MRGGKYVIEYIWTEAEEAEEIAALNGDPNWVADHDDETAEDFVAGYARSYVGADYSIVGTDYPTGDALVFDLKDEAEDHAITMRTQTFNGEKCHPGEFVVHELATRSQ